jgi:hypothetical protein
MVVLELCAQQQIAENQRILGNHDADRIIDCPHRGQSMGVLSDPTRTLHKIVGIPGISSL